MSIAFIVSADTEAHPIDKGLFAVLPGNRREQADSYRRYSDKVRCYGAGLAAIAAASHFCRCAPEDIVLYTGNWKAPYAIDGNSRKVCLSISHSGSYILCSADSEPCGADVETIREIADPEKLADRFFTPSEAERIRSADTPGKNFIEYWTMKEAYVKYLGTGLSRRLDSFSCEYSAGAWTISDSERGDADRLLCRNFTGNGSCFSFVTKNPVTETIRLTLTELEQMLKKYYMEADNELY